MSADCNEDNFTPEYSAVLQKDYQHIKKGQLVTVLPGLPFGDNIAIRLETGECLQVPKHVLDYDDDLPPSLCHEFQAISSGKATLEHNRNKTKK